MHGGYLVVAAQPTCCVVIAQPTVQYTAAHKLCSQESQRVLSGTISYLDVFRRLDFVTTYFLSTGQYCTNSVVNDVYDGVVAVKLVSACYYCFSGR